MMVQLMVRLDRLDFWKLGWHCLMPAFIVSVMIFKCLLLIVSLISGIFYSNAQGSKNLVSVRFADSALMNFYLQTAICDSFTCILQNEKLLFYENSYRSQAIDFSTGEVLGTNHLSPRKYLIDSDKVVTYYDINSKQLSQQISKSKLYQLPLLLLNKFKIEEFIFDDETKLVSGILCRRGISPGPDGDTAIIWMQKPTEMNNLKSIFNLYFISPPSQPILEYSIKNFHLGNAVVAELTYSIHSFQIGDFSKDFSTLLNYTPCTQEEVDAEMAIINERLLEENRTRKKN